MRKKRCLFISFLLLVLLGSHPCLALSGKEHWQDMQRVFPFDMGKENSRVFAFYSMVNQFLDYPYLQPGTKFDKKAPKRPKSIAEHPKFSQIHWMGKHRIWFHWGFNTDPRQFPPIVNSLNTAVSSGVIAASDLPEFWNLMNEEISVRNRALMNEGAAVFGFGQLGAVSSSERRQINGLVTILYSIHVLGDHQTEDTVVIAPLKRVYADIYSAIDNLAGKDSANFQKAKILKKTLKSYQYDSRVFVDKMAVLFPDFILSLSGPGYDYASRWRKMGYKLKK